jgi:hypothetical protein
MRTIANHESASPVINITSGSRLQYATFGLAFLDNFVGVTVYELSPCQADDKNCRKRKGYPEEEEDTWVLSLMVVKRFHVGFSVGGGLQVRDRDEIIELASVETAGTKAL